MITLIVAVEVLVEELRWWSRSMLVAALVAVLLLFLGPVSYKLGLSPLQPAFVGLLIALVVGVVTALLGLIAAIVAQVKSMPRNRNLVLISTLVALLAPAVMVPQIVKARSVPPIHDITTDTNEPPEFVAVIALRANAANDLKYGMEGIPPEEMARLQRDAYPDVKTLSSELSVADAVTRSSDVLDAMGIEVVSVDADQGLVEGTATTFWFGFKDDVVVRVRPSESGSIIDMRSVSRVGRSDVGANAARISTFLESF